MIPNQWYVVLDSSELRDKPLGVLRLGERLVFWRDTRGAAHCLEDHCVHRGIQLCLGKVIGDRLQCPFHGFEYDGQGKIRVIPANGRSTAVPAAFQVRSYPTYEAQGFIWIWRGEQAPQPSQPSFFTDLDTSFSYAEVHDHWNAHYSRVIENQLDVVHVPFIHANTIGRGGRTLVDGPGVKWISPDMFHVYVFNRLDDGRPPLGPHEVPLEPEPSFKLEFLFPNLWENYISKETRILAAFVPVDATHTILYLRFYQNFVRLPGLRTLVNRLAMPFNVYVAHQDRRVVETHEPTASSLKMGEQLIRGDYPIIEYRRRREELKNGRAAR